MPKMGQRGIACAELFLDRVRVPLADRLGAEGQGFYGLMRTFDASRVLIAAACTGLSRAATDAAVAYGKEKEQFGTPIIGHQAVAFRLADMAAKTDVSALLTRRAADLHDAGESITEEAAIAKLTASENAVWCAWAAMQTVRRMGVLAGVPRGEVAARRQAGGARRGDLGHPAVDHLPFAGPVMTGAAAVAATLAGHGVDTVFGIPGTHNLALYEALSARGMRLVTPRHEQGAGYAADGYARISGRPGVVLTTTGPGILNAADGGGAGLLRLDPVAAHLARGAHDASAPEHRLPARDEEPVGGDGRGLRVEPSGDDGGRDPLGAGGGVHLLRGGRARPVHIEIPADLLDAPGDFTLPARGGLPDAAAALAGGGTRGHRPGRRGPAGGRGGPPTGRDRERPGRHHDQRHRHPPPTHHRNLGPALFLHSTQTWLKSCDVVVAVGTELAPSDLWTDFTYEGTLIRIDVDPGQTTNATIPVVARAEAAPPRADRAPGVP